MQSRCANKVRSSLSHVSARLASIALQPHIYRRGISDAEADHIMLPHQSGITHVLSELRDASREEVLDRLVPLVYAELHAMAEAQLRHERADHTLQPTALVHEAYLRLLGEDYPVWHHRRHFFHAAAEAMRRILVDHARRRTRVKRGGQRVQVPLRGLELVADGDPEEFLALDDAIRRLAERDPRAAEIVRLRFFAGLSVDETARTLEISERTVKREWAVARAWLYDALHGS